MQSLQSPKEFIEDQQGLENLFQRYVDISEKKRSYYDNNRKTPFVAEIKDAIKNRYYVGIYYEETKESGVVKSGFRLIEPYAYGLGFVSPQTGEISYPDRKYLRAFVIMDTEKDDLVDKKFPVSRRSVSKTNREPFWRQFRIDRISTWFAFPKRFSRYRNLYNPNDKMMRRVITSLDYDQFPFGQRAES